MGTKPILLDGGARHIRNPASVTVSNGPQPWPPSPRTSRTRLSAHVDHVFGVMGNGNAAFLDALHDTERALHRHAARGGRSSPPTRTTGRRAARRRDRDVRRGLHEHAHPARRGRAGPRPARARGGRRTHVGPAPWDVDQIAMAAAVGARDLHGGPSGCRDDHGIAVEHAWPSACPWCSPSPTTSRTRESGRPPHRRPRSPCRCPPRPTPPSSSPNRRDAGRGRAAAAPRGPRRVAGRRRRGAAGSPTRPARSPRRRRSRAASSPTRATTSASPAGSAQEARWPRARRGRRRGVRRVAQPVHHAVRRALRPGRAGRAGRHRPAATHPTSGRYVRGDAALVARALVAELEALGDDPVGVARVDRPRAPPRARPGRRRRGRTAGSTRAASPPASASCCPPTAWSSPTAATSSAGRTCTGRSPRPTA